MKLYAMGCSNFSSIFSMEGKVIHMKLLKALLLSLMVILVCTPSFGAEEVIRIGVLKFETKADGISSRNAEAITDELTRMLTSSYSIAIIDRSTIDAIAREQRMSLAGLIDPRTAAQLGHAAGIQYLITGAVTNFGITKDVKKTDTHALWELIAGKKTANHLGSTTVEVTENAEVTLNLRVIDVNTQEVVMSIAETGKATRTTKASGGNENSLSSANATTQNISLRDSAISDAVTRIGYRIKEAVAGEYPQVLRVSGGEIYISIGAKAGGKVGSRYKVSFEGEDITDMRGNVVGKDTTPLAIIQIDDVKNDYSTARVISKKAGDISNIQRGDRVDATTSSEIDSLIKRKAFPSRRPRRALSSSNLEGADLDSRLNNISSASTEGAITTSSVASQSSVPVGTRVRENYSTDPSKVIPTYGLPAGEARSREQLHKNLQKAGKNKNVYDRYVEMANSYAGDYLAMYQAGIVAQSMGRKNDAAMWFDKTLQANPNYEPAKEAKEKLNKAPSSSKSSSGSRKSIKGSKRGKR